MSRQEVKFWVSMAFWIILFFAFVLLAPGCKTRKVATQTSDVKKTSVISEENAVKDSSKTKTSDNSTTTKDTHTQAKNTEKSKTTLNADSIVTTTTKAGGKKTVIYPKGPVNIDFEGTSDQDINESMQHINAINTEASTGHDSSGKKQISTTQDSTGKIKNIDAKGSGTTWATYVPIIGGIVLVVGLILVFIYFKAKKKVTPDI